MSNPAGQKPQDSSERQRRRPPWLRVRVGSRPCFERVSSILRSHRLHTVCEEAHCPNIHECYGAGTATFLIMGDICTRSCRFCAIKSGKPKPLDPTEPRRVAEAVRALGLAYVVVTSVDRDDLPDGGACHFAATVQAIRTLAPGCRIEVLTPDFRGELKAIEQVLAAGPDVFGHNVETVRKLFARIRSGGRYERSLGVLGFAAERKRKYGAAVKSGFMLGLGELAADIEETLRDLAQAGCDIVTIGQYLSPSAEHYPVERFVTPEEFRAWERRGLELGIPTVYAGPLVRSSYHAEEQARSLKRPPQ